MNYKCAWSQTRKIRRVFVMVLKIIPLFNQTWTNNLNLATLPLLVCTKHKIFFRWSKWDLYLCMPIICWISKVFPMSNVNVVMLCFIIECSVKMLYTGSRVKSSSLALISPLCSHCSLIQRHLKLVSYIKFIIELLKTSLL